MLRTLWAILAFLFMFGCGSTYDTAEIPSLKDILEDKYGEDGYIVDPDNNASDHDGDGGGMPYLTLPFPSGKWWVVTQTYNTGTHQNWGFEYGDDRYALDFTRNGCDAYGEEVTPIADGYVSKVTYDGYGDQGYGNSVIINHGEGYYSRYGHLADIYVGLGESVDINRTIGLVGNTGYSVGTACSEHPGTHLHLVFYRENGGWPEGTKPEPMSGIYDFTYNCWYNRDGGESCWGDPGDYEATEEIDDEGELNLTHFDINPSWGTAGETEFIWTSVVDSPDYQPDATLQIYNSNDGHTYDFDMALITHSNPWVFVYRKSLRDPLTYTYWVEVSNGDGNDRSGVESVRVYSKSDQKPNIYRLDWSPASGQAGSTEFEWEVSFVSRGDPDAILKILNPNDGHVYDFDMDRRGSSYWWSAEYEKTLRDEANYLFWVEVNNGDTVTTSELGRVRTY